jgi:Holliday junction DNA helicase RuvA
MSIARLRGIFEEAGPEGALVDVGGVGYLALVSTRTRASLPAQGEAVTLLIEQQIREDSHTLYGFIDRAERDWFRHLTTVQGVGGKVALAILSVLEPDALARAILAGDRASLSRADGVGPKLAMRLVTELKDRAGAWTLAPGIAAMGKVPAAASSPGRSPAFGDAVAALIGLQFRPLEAETAVAAAVALLGESATVNDLVGAALRAHGR